MNTSINKKSVYNIINALRSGIVPQEGLSYLVTGNEKEIHELTEELEYIADGNTAIRFIQGDYGSGKTFLSYKLAEIAISKGFAVSTVIISQTNILSNLSNIYKSIIDGLRTKGKTEGAAFIDILDNWSFNQFNRIKKIEHGSNNYQEDNNFISTLSKNIEHSLISSQNIHPVFAKCVMAYATAKIRKDPDKARLAISWLKGVESISNSEYRNELGIKGKLENKDVLSFLKGIINLIKDSGHKGLLIIFDEIETIQRLQNKKHRQDSYETIRILIDEVGINSYKNTMFIMTGTPQFFEDKRFGIPSYPALYDRISSPTKVIGDSIKQPIIKLKRLDENSLLNISKKVLNLYKEAFICDSILDITDNNIKEFIKVLSENFGEINSKPRDYIRRFIKLLDLKLEYPDTPIYSFINAPVEL
jgi:hypothetical protein